MASRWLKYLTDWWARVRNYETREVLMRPKREVKTLGGGEELAKETRGNGDELATAAAMSAAERSGRCIYCDSKDVIRRGKRRKRFELVQLYQCNHCGRTFTPQRVKGHHYPLKVILEGLTLHNLGYTLEDSVRLIRERFGLNLKASTLSDWVGEFKNLCTYARIRRFGAKLFSPNQIVRAVSLYHRQVYRFRIHQAKLALVLQEDPRHHKFWPVKEFLEAMFAECPHHLFKEGMRASEVKVKFNLAKVIVRAKHNYACRIAELVLQAMGDNKLRHEAMQRWMIANDSVTIATEVPVYLLPEDLEHMESQLGFEIPVKIDRVLTGHIDVLQMRNGAVHILDFKPNARREKPIEQLTMYALALSRLTGLRLYDFKCAWFDERDYFEFFPLHIVYKLRGRERVPKNQMKLLDARPAVEVESHVPV